MEKAHLSGTNVYDTYRLNTAHMITGVKYRADSAEYGSVGAFGTYRTFDIDGLGNRTDIDVNGTTYNYGPDDGNESTDPLNRYTQAGGWSLTYDDNGRVTDDGRNSYTWNDAGRLESGTGMYGQSFTYTYDAFDRRVKTDIDGTETFFFYDKSENVLEEQDSSGALQRQYVYGEGMDTPLQLVDAMSGETYYYHTDALGSVTELTDASGSVAESYEYDVYGDVTIYEDSAGGSEIDFGEGTQQPYLFAARRYDSETENYYNRARYYSPDLGRFLSPDPLGYHDSMNIYQYALNNPMLYTDPTGEFVGAVVVGFAVFEAASTLYDAYDAYKTFSNEDSTTADKGVSLGFLYLGVKAPGPGALYKKGAKEAMEFAAEKTTKKGVEKAAKASTKKVKRTAAERGLEKNVEHISEVHTFSKARREAKQLSGLNSNGVPFHRTGPYMDQGKWVGMQSKDGLRGWRVDFDPNKQLHVNWWDNSAGRKRKDQLYGAIQVKGGTEADYISLLEHLFGNKPY